MTQPIYSRARLYVTPAAKLSSHMHHADRLLKRGQKVVQNGPLRRGGQLLLCLTMMVWANAALAGDLVLGLGQDNLDTSSASEATAFHLEYHTDAIRSYNWGTVAVMGVLEYDDDDDFFAGAGLSLIWDVAPKWFVETSLAAGYYDAGSDGLDLGGDFQFRTLLGFGYRVSETSRISLAVDHLSNAGIEDINPGRNGLFLRYARSF